MSTPSVVVVGAGAIGLCTAFELHELGVRDLVVLEKRTPGSGSSGLAVGIIETQYLDPVPIALRVYAMDFFARLEREAGLPITRNGYLRLGHSEADAGRYARSVAIQRELGVADAVVLDRPAIERLVPGMVCDDVVCGLWGPSDGFCDPALTCTIVAGLLRDRGVDLRTGTELVGAEQAASGGWVLTTGGGETLRCDVVVNAAGAWATPVGELLGARSEVLPQRHKALFARLPRPFGFVMPSVMDYVPGSGRMGLYVRHDTDTAIVAGLHTEDPVADIVDPDRFRRGDDNRYMVAVGEELARRLPAFADAGLDGVWAGIYPISPDGEPSIGPYRDRPSVCAALGAGGSGFQSAPGIGRTVAEWIVHGEPRTVPDAGILLPDRGR